MKRKLKKLGLLLLLMVHSFVVVCIPVTSWVVALIVKQPWLDMLSAVLYFFVQIPIAVYAMVKKNSIYKIIDKITHI